MDRGGFLDRGEKRVCVPVCLFEARETSFDVVCHAKSIPSHDAGFCFCWTGTVVGRGPERRLCSLTLCKQWQDQAGCNLFGDKIAPCIVLLVKRETDCWRQAHLTQTWTAKLSMHIYIY